MSHGITRWGNVKARPVGSADTVDYEVINVRHSTFEELKKWELKDTGQPIPSLEESLNILK